MLFYIQFTGPDGFRCSEEEYLQEAGYDILLLNCASL